MLMVMILNYMGGVKLSFSGNLNFTNLSAVIFTWNEFG